MNNEIVVIMCVYKNDPLEQLIKSVSSVLNQSKGVDFYIYIDGDIPKCVYSYLSKIDIENSAVKLFSSRENRGLAFGLNVLLEKALDAGYEFIARMDSDDIAYAIRMEAQYEYMLENNDIDVLGTSCREFGSSFSLKEKHLPSKHNDLFVFSITRCPFIHPTVMFRSRVFTSGIRYPENTPFTEDMALWFLLLDSNFKFGNLNQILLDYRLNENTIERRRGINKAFSEMKLRFKYMLRLNQFSLKNVIFISARLFFHMMPELLIKQLYLKLR